jgi:hypothetical protein
MLDLTGFVLTRLVAVSLDLLGYARTAALLARAARLTRRAAPPVAARDRAVAVARRVEKVAARRPLPVGCLPRALVVRTILASEGIDATVRIGVQRSGGTFRAHAWVEHERVPVAEAGQVLAGFAPFDHDFGPAAAP